MSKEHTSVVEIRRDRGKLIFFISVLFISTIGYPLYIALFEGEAGRAVASIVLPFTLISAFLIRKGIKNSKYVLHVDERGIRYSPYTDRTILWKFISEISIKYIYVPRGGSIFNLLIRTSQVFPQQKTMLGKFDSLVTSGGISLVNLTAFEGSPSQIVSYLNECKLRYDHSQGNKWSLPVYDKSNKNGIKSGT